MCPYVYTSCVLIQMCTYVCISYIYIYVYIFECKSWGSVHLCDYLCSKSLVVSSCLIDFLLHQVSMGVSGTKALTKLPGLLR